MYLFIQNYFQKTLICALYFSIISAVGCQADRSDGNSRDGNNNMSLIIHTDPLTLAEKTPDITMKYSTKKINSAQQLYSMENFYNLRDLRSFQSFTVEKMKNSAQSSITFLSDNSQEKMTSVSFYDGDTLIISDLKKNTIFIQKKNTITGAVVLVARFSSLK